MAGLASKSPFDRRSHPRTEPPSRTPSLQAIASAAPPHWLGLDRLSRQTRILDRTTMF